MGLLSIIVYLTICVSTLQGADLLRPGNLVVSTLNGDWQTIWAVDAASGSKQQLAQLHIGYDNIAIAMTSDRRLFIAQDQWFRVLQVNLQDGSYKAVAGIGNVVDIEAAPDDTLWFRDVFTIYHFDPNTGRLLVQICDGENNPLQLHGPRGLGIESDGSVLKAYTGYIGNNDGAVTKMNPVTGEETLIAMFDNTHDVVSDGNGHIFALDHRQINENQDSPDNLIRIDESTGASSVLVSGLPTNYSPPSNLVFSPGNGLYVDAAFGTPQIWHIDPATGAENVLATFDYPYRISGLTVIPAPEPAMLTLLAACGICLLAYRFRRRLSVGAY